LAVQPSGSGVRLVGTGLAAHDGRNPPQIKRSNGRASEGARRYSQNTPTALRPGRVDVPRRVDLPDAVGAAGWLRAHNP
jgi:hypothetical protein